MIRAESSIEITDGNAAEHTAARAVSTPWKKPDENTTFSAHP
jgi:hypothetical protein